MAVRLHPGATQDIRDTHRFYLETAGIEVASRFRAEIRFALTRIERFPATWPLQFGARRCVLRSFPYSVFYETDETRSHRGRRLSPQERAWSLGGAAARLDRRVRRRLKPTAMSDTPTYSCYVKGTDRERGAVRDSFIWAGARRGMLNAFSDRASSYGDHPDR